MSQASRSLIAPAPVENDDFALMAGLQARDSGAMSTLYQRYSPIVFALCRRGLRDQQEAEDLLLDIFAEIWERADRFDPSRGSPIGHIMGVARSRLIDRIRSRQSAARSGASRALDISSFLDISGADATPGQAAIFAERQTQVRIAVGRLAADQREALELAFFEGLSHSEVAERLGQPLGTVKSRIRQAMMVLRDLLNRLE